MKLSTFTGGMAQTNAYLAETPQGNFLIDAPEGVAAWLAGRGVRVDHLLLTHQHYDHVQDAAAVAATGAGLLAHSPHSTELTLEVLLRQWGVSTEVAPYTVDRLLAPGEPLEMLGLAFHIHHVPGHAADSLVFHLPDFQLAFCGDTVFAGSIGRTDLPGGDTDLLLSGIREKILSLPAETRLLPGHGPATRVDAERQGNPFLR